MIALISPTPARCHDFCDSSVWR